MNRIRPTMAALAASIAVGWAGFAAMAGEPIRFSNDRSKPAPDAPNKLTHERFSTRDRVSTVSPFDALSTPGLNLNSRRMDPKEEKRLKNAKLEEKNWMLLDKGELQEQDDQETSFGVRDYSGDSLEKDSDKTAEIWFGSHQDRGDKAAGASRVSGSSPRLTVPGRQQSTVRPIENDIKFGAEKTLSFEPISESGQNTGKETSFQNLAPDPDANHALKELFNLGSPANRTAVEPERGRESFGLRSINALPSPTTPGIARPFGLSPDIGRPAPALIEGPRIQSGPIGSGIGSSRVNSSLDYSKFNLNRASHSSVTPLAQPRNDHSPAPTRDLFAPPPRPGQLGSR